MTHAMVKGSTSRWTPRAYGPVLRWSRGRITGCGRLRACCSGADARVRSTPTSSFYQRAPPSSGLARHLPKAGPEGLTDTVEVDLAALDATVDRWWSPASCDGGAFSLVQELTLLIYDAAAQHAAPLISFEVVPDTGHETA